MDIATIVASGNNSYINAISKPACISSAISVGATTDSDNVAFFSNSASFLTLLAPGFDTNSSIPGGGFVEKSGTSMAAPHVAGIWAASFLLGLAVYTRAISNLFLYASVAIIMGIIGVVLLVRNYLK